MSQEAILQRSLGQMKETKEICLNDEPDSNNFYATLVENKNIAVIPSFTLESNVTITSAPVAYSSWGSLNEGRNNVLVICHALTGSSDAMDWWRPLFGPGKALDPARFFIFCANVLGSPYGSASSVATNPDTQLPYGPAFPQTTIRDDVRIHKVILDALGVHSVAAVIGGSMGGMTTLEWPLCTPPGYVKNIIPITTSAYHGGWGISWGETQRQAIYSDATFENGWYEPSPTGQPRKGLRTARMIAMLTYRSQCSFEARFSRKPARIVKLRVEASLPTPPSSNRGSVAPETQNTEEEQTPIEFSAQSYLHYQADKFLKRFDANCYIHLTKKMDTHDITRDRLTPKFSPEPTSYPPTEEDLRRVLCRVPSKTLVVSVETDLLFRPEQQIELAKCLPEAKFLNLESTDGHDGFLLEFAALNKAIKRHLEERCAWIYEGKIEIEETEVRSEDVVNSVFGEAETIEF